MVLSNKHSFWQALIVALVIFWTGILLGVFFENSRANRLEEFYFNAETDIFDIMLNGDILKEGEFNCRNVIKENIEFADRIFGEAKALEKYDAATKITGGVLALHKRYDLLRVMLWSNVLDLQEKCPGYTNVVIYLYQYDNPDINVGAMQITFSKVLVDLKDKYGDKVLLIPIAHDTGVKSLELLLDKYDLVEFPVVLVNQEKSITNIFTLEEIEEFLDEALLSPKIRVVQ